MGEKGWKKTKWERGQGQRGKIHKREVKLDMKDTKQSDASESKGKREIQLQGEKGGNESCDPNYTHIYTRGEGWKWVYIYIIL